MAYLIKVKYDLLFRDLDSLQVINLTNELFWRDGLVTRQ
jgi:hypothetical protein